MATPIQPGPQPGPIDRERARARYQLLQAELPRVRTAATAWRNGLAGLLAAIAGFGLIRGRSDVTLLAPGYAAVVGLLLAASVAVGGVAALSLLRAAHGRPAVVPAESVLPPPLDDHHEAIASALALRRGIVLAMACAALLVAAVAVTWYGPERHAPQLRLQLAATTVCGTVTSIHDGTAMVLSDGQVTTVNMRAVIAIQPADSC